MFLCCTKDEEGQCLGAICLGRQCGVAPTMCCDKDDDGMCWGCVCFYCQFDPCWLNRYLLHGCCLGLRLCGLESESCKLNIFKILCCNYKPIETDGEVPGGKGAPKNKV